MDNNNHTVSQTQYPRPNSNGYVPRPLDTSGVELNENIRLIADRLASNSHDVWGRKRVLEGWAYGPERDDKKLTNPCMVYYDELPDADKKDDQDTALGALKFIMSKGYKIKERPSPSMADMMKTAWTDYGRKESDLDFSSTVFIGIFCSDHSKEFDPDHSQLTSALHDYFRKLYCDFEQGDAVSGSLRGSALTGSHSFRRRTHTRFIALSPESNEGEALACAIARSYGISTYKVYGGSDTLRLEGGTIYAAGDAVSFICDHSLLALAAWDGIQGSDRRMNAIIERSLKGSLERLGELDMPDNITVHHMLLPMSSTDSGGTNHPLYAIRELHPYPLESGQNWFCRNEESCIKATDRFNLERYERSKEKIIAYNRAVRKYRRTVMNSKKVYDLMPGLHGHPQTDRTLLRHIYADQISMAAQTKCVRCTKAMALLAFGGLSAYSLLSDAPEKLFGIDMSGAAIYLSALVVLLLLAAMLLIHLRKASHRQYIDFRLISECLRVQTYWIAADVGRRAEDEFGAKAKLDFEWTRYILRSWELADLLNPVPGIEFSESIINEVKNVWIGRDDVFNGTDYGQEKGVASAVSQYNYSRKKANSSLKGERIENMVVTASIVLTFVLTILVGVLIFIEKLSGTGMEAIDYISLLAGLVQVGTACFTLYTTTKDFSRLSNNHTWLSIEYQKSIMAYRGAANNEQRCKLLRRTGREAIREVCGWALEFSRNEPRTPIS